MPETRAGKCRFCLKGIVPDRGSWKSAEGQSFRCEVRDPASQGHLPFMCYCGGPEESVYGHPVGTGAHCRSESEG